jgi:hypothetical protein
MGLPKTIPAPDDARLIALGRRVEELLANEDPPDELRDAVALETMKKEELSDEAYAAWVWFRGQFNIGLKA